MAEFGPNSPLSDDGCQPVQPAVNWATMQAMPQAMGLLLLSWGKAAERRDLLVFPEDHLQTICPRLWHFCGNPGL